MLSNDGCVTLCSICFIYYSIVFLVNINVDLLVFIDKFLSIEGIKMSHWDLLSDMYVHYRVQAWNGFLPLAIHM